jgi:MFS family permease
MDPVIRRLGVTTLLTSVGYGMYLPVSMLYFHRHLGIPVAGIGLGLSVAGLASVACAAPVGHAADRIGPRRVAVGLASVQAAALAALPAVRSYPLFILTVTVLAVADTGAATSRAALVSAVLGPAGRVRAAALLRSVANAGMTVGIGGAGLVLTVDRPAAFQAVIWANALARAVVAGLHLGLPRIPGAPRPDGRGASWQALRDLPYLAVAHLTGLRGLDNVILTVGLPLWLVTRTAAPRPMIAWLTGVNTILVLAFQVRVSRGADSLDGAARLQRAGLAALVAACLAAACAAGLSATAASAVLVIAVVALSLAEIAGSAAAWCLQFELAPADAQGQYLGAFALGAALPGVVGPALVTVAIARFDRAGWVLLALLFAGGLTATGPVLRRAGQRVPRAVSAAE